MILQLSPMLPVITPKGSGYAFLVIDYSQEHDLLFSVIIDDTGEIWTFNNKEIRATANITMGRPSVISPEKI